MGSHGVVVDPPGFDETACFMQRREDMFVEAFIAQPAVKGFDESILHRLSRLDVVPGHPVDGPAQHRAAG